jgi:tetratricopeptide (TPR) repeat protein
MAKLPYSGSPLTKLLAAQSPGQANITAKKRRSGQESAPHVVPMLQEGIALQTMGKLGLAAEVYQRILAKHPNNPDALHLMGTVAMSLGQVDGALDLFKRAVAGKPNDPAIRCNLANALMEKDDSATAEFHLRKALKLYPNFAAALCFLADCRTAAGNRQEARRLYEEVLARLPDDPQALIGYADLCVTLGEMENARAIYRKAIALNAVPALALAGLATCEKLPKDSPEAAQIKRYLREPGLRPVDHLNLSYAAGSIAEAAGDYDEAFSHFSAAKKLGAGTFDIDTHRRMHTMVKSVFTKQFFETRAKYGDASKRPIFVVGMPRSGTTLTEQIIARHPDAAAAGELGDVTRIAASLGLRREDAKDYAKRLTKLTPQEAKALAGRYLSVLDHVSADAQRVTDKMPQNFEHLGLIALLFPNARIVHCRRDPLDTCVSCFTMHLKDHNHGYATDLGTLGSYYREYDSLMAHWREVLPLAIYELDYERLIEAPEEQSRKLIAFVGLPWDPACLTPHESARPVRTLSRMQVRQPIYSTSVGRWRRYDKHLAPLKAALGDLAATAGGGDPASG